MPVITKTEPYLAFEPVNKSFCLEQICASNYQKLFKLIPDLSGLQKAAVGSAPSHTNLYVDVVDRSVYTMTIRLSHCFNLHTDERLEPDVIIRIYLDAQLVEVLGDHARQPVTRVFKPALSADIMHYKWRLNYFLQKWLDHCLSKNYRFSASTQSI